MKTANLINKMRKNNIQVDRTEIKQVWGTQVNYVARFNRMAGEWSDDDGDTSSVYIRKAHLQDDPQSDYFCGSFARTITQAVNLMINS